MKVKFPVLKATLQSPKSVCPSVHCFRIQNPQTSSNQSFHLTTTFNSDLTTNFTTTFTTNFTTLLLFVLFRTYSISVTCLIHLLYSGYTWGLHVWKITWPADLRGTHPVVGVATRDCHLTEAGYKRLVGSTASSWGWCLKSMKVRIIPFPVEIIPFPVSGLPWL